MKDALTGNMPPLPADAVWTPLLPAGVSNGSLAIKVEERDETHAVFLITARSADQYAAQRVTYHKDAERWILITGTLTQFNAHVPTSRP